MIPAVARSQGVLIIGTGPVSVCTVETGVRSGWRRPTIVSEEDESAVWRAAVKATRDPGQEIRRATADDHLPGLISGADLVVQVEPFDRVDRLVEVAWECARAGVSLGQMLVRDEDAWLASTAGPDVEMAWRRLAARSGHRGQQHPWLSGAVPTVLAAQFVLTAFRNVTGMSEPDVRLIRIDLRDLNTSAHQLPDSPGETPSAWASRSTADRIAALQQATPDTVSGLLRRVRPYVDEHVGLIGALSEGAISQVPLAICTAATNDPGRTVTVAGWGVSREVARCRAVLGALAERAWSTVARQSTDRAFLRGKDVLTGDVRPVRADALGVVGNHVPDGVAAGLSWTEAVEAGLLALWERIVRIESPAAVDIDCGLVDTDRDVDQILALLEQTGANHQFHDHTKACGLPVYSVAVDGRVVALSSGARPVEALHGASARALLAWQIKSTDRDTVAVPPIRRPWLKPRQALCRTRWSWSVPGG